MGAPSRAPKQPLPNKTKPNTTVKGETGGTKTTTDNTLASSTLGKEDPGEGKKEDPEKEQTSEKVEIKDSAPVKPTSKDVKGITVLSMYHISKIQKAYTKT